MRIGLLIAVVASSALAQSAEKGGSPARALRRTPLVLAPGRANADQKKAEALDVAVRAANEAQRDSQALAPNGDLQLDAVRPPAPPVAPEPVKSNTPGNDIYRWVDGEGVVHYSTSVPPAYKGIAKKVGAKP